MRITMLFGAYDHLGKREMFQKRLTQIKIILDAILSSGDGRSKKTAIYVIKVNHEYFVLNILGFEYGDGQMLLDNKFDYLTVNKNDQGIDGLYFDISISLEKLNDLFK